MNYKKLIKDVPDFPIPGILFRDITPLLANGSAYHRACKEIASFVKEQKGELIVGPESRGFIVGCPVSIINKIGFVPIRKPGKLPRETVDLSYDLEYGHNTLSLHKDAIQPGQKVVIVDDLLATGGTVKAAVELIEKLGGIVVGLAFLIELKELGGRQLLQGYDIFTLIEY